MYCKLVHEKYESIEKVIVKRDEKRTKMNTNVSILCFKMENRKSWNNFHIFFVFSFSFAFPFQISEKKKAVEKMVKIATFWIDRSCILWMVANANLFHCRYFIVLPNEFRMVESTRLSMYKMWMNGLAFVCYFEKRT